MKKHNSEYQFVTDIDKGIVLLSKRIGLPSDFFKRLLNEDDWSFIIKLHALIEAACTQLLIHHFQEPSLYPILAKLELSNKTIGKIAILKELELLEEYDRKYIYQLSELRNKLVHDISQFSFSIKDMVKNYDDNEIKQFAKINAPYEMLMINFPKTLRKDAKLKLNLKFDNSDQFSIEKLINRAKADHKFHIWVGAYTVLINIIDSHGFSDYKNWLKTKYMLNEE